RRWTSARGLMSSIATKPSVRLTTVAGASPLAIRQKMQSAWLGSEDPLLRHPGSAHPDELADHAVDEPGRVVVPATAPPASDQNEVLATDLSAPVAQQGVVRLGSQALAPVALIPLRNGVLCRSPRAGAWRVGKDVHPGDSRVGDHAGGVAKGLVVLAGEADDD